MAGEVQAQPGQPGILLPGEALGLDVVDPVRHPGPRGALGRGEHPRQRGETVAGLAFQRVHPLGVLRVDGGVLDHGEKDGPAILGVGVHPEGKGVAGDPGLASLLERAQALPVDPRQEGGVQARPGRIGGGHAAVRRVEHEHLAGLRIDQKEVIIHLKGAVDQRESIDLHAGRGHGRREGIGANRAVRTGRLVQFRDGHSLVAGGTDHLVRPDRRHVHHGGPVRRADQEDPTSRQDLELGEEATRLEAGRPGSSYRILPQDGGSRADMEPPLPEFEAAIVGAHRARGNRAGNRAGRGAQVQASFCLEDREAVFEGQDEFPAVETGINVEEPVVVGPGERQVLHPEGSPRTRMAFGDARRDVELRDLGGISGVQGRAREGCGCERDGPEDGHYVGSGHISGSLCRCGHGWQSCDCSRTKFRPMS